MLSEESLIKKLLPYSAITVCLLVISRFLVEPFLFPVNIDDCLYAALLRDHSVWELTQMLSGKYNGAYIAHFDGRIFSNFYSLLVFDVLKTNYSQYYLYDLLMFFVLAGSFSFLFSSLIKNNILSPLTKFNNLLLSLFVSCVIYVFLLDGRYEVFYWVSGISNHLLSLIFFIISLALFTGKTSAGKTFILALLSFCFGQMNEAYAVNYFIVFLLLLIANPKKKFTFLVMLLMVGLSLYINLSAYGTAVRFNTLYAIETHFNFKGALIDSIDTLKLPFENYRYIPIKIPVAILLFLLLRDYLKLHFKLSNKHFLIFNRILFAAALLSIFMHCYILGEICTYRGLLYYFLTLVYFIFVMASQKTINPLKLFLR